MKENLSNLITLIEKIEGLTKEHGTDVLYTHYESKEEIDDELKSHIMLLHKEDLSKMNTLILLFSPTSDLQELAISNGWSKQYLEISSQFDKIINKIKEAI